MVSTPKTLDQVTGLRKSRAMRIVSIIFYFLSGLALLAWAFVYMYIHALACAFGSINGTCSTKWPWQLNGSDFLGLVLVPGLIVAGLLIIAILTGRQARQL